jgi:hypothetical protein
MESCNSKPTLILFFHNIVVVSNPSESSPALARRERETTGLSSDEQRDNTVSYKFLYNLT